MELFTCKTKYVNQKDCYFQVSRYKDNNNIALTIFNNEEGPMMTVTVNPGVGLPDNYIALKDYSENEGTIDFMKSLGLIADAPVSNINSGFVLIPIYRLTDKALEWFDIKYIV